MSSCAGREQNKYEWISNRSKQPRKSIASNHRVQKAQVQKYFDTNDKLVQIVSFHLTKDSYLNFIEQIRRIINARRPVHTPYPIMKVVLTTLDQLVEKFITGIILKSNLYFLGVDNGFLLEFGNTNAIVPPRRFLLDSTFLGYSDSYPAMGGLEGLIVGYAQFHEAIITISNDKSRLVVGKYDPLFEQWKRRLAVILVMVSEGTRFKPFSYLFDLEMKKGRDSRRGQGLRINKNMCNMIRGFAKMSEKAESIVPSTMYCEPYVFPAGLFDCKEEDFENMMADQVFCQQNLGVLNKKKIGFGGVLLKDDKKKRKKAKPKKEQYRKKTHLPPNQDVSV